MDLFRKRTVRTLLPVTFLAIAVVATLYISDRAEDPESKSMSNNSNTPTQDQPMKGDSILIVYLTRTGNTEAVARMIQDTVGGTLVSLELEQPYPEGYQAHVAQVVRESESGYLPPLKTSIENIESYDTVFLGFPTWDMQLPPPIRSFLNEYDLSGKTVIPFNTNGGYGVGSSFQEIEERCSNCTVLEGFSVEGGRERDGIIFVMEGNKEVEVRAQVRDWLEKNRSTFKIEYSL
jgi:flavodoxin